MAKSKQFDIKDRISHIVWLGYVNGVWHSTIFHTLLFLLLIFIVEAVPQPPMKPIVISFVDNPEMELLDTPSISLESELIDDGKLAQTQNENENAYLSLVENPSIDVNLEIEDNNTSQSDHSLPHHSMMLKKIVTDEQDQVKDHQTDPIPSSNSVANKPIKHTISLPKKTVKTNNKKQNPLLEMIAGGAKLQEGIPSNFIGTSDSNNDRGGFNGDQIEQRLQGYGAKTGDIQVSLIWNTVDDIDLHVQYINNQGQEIIFWHNRFGMSGGILDIDMNGSGPQSNTPIENIFWPFGSAPSGRYVIAVHFFRAWTRNTVVPAVIRLKTAKGVMFYNVKLVLGQPRQIVVDFTH